MKMKVGLIGLAVGLVVLVSCRSRGFNSKSDTLDTTHGSPFLGGLAQRIAAAPKMTLDTYMRFLNNKSFYCRVYRTFDGASVESEPMAFTYVFGKQEFDSLLRLKRFDPTDGQYYDSTGTVGNGFANFALVDANTTLALRLENSGSLIGEVVDPVTDARMSVSQSTGYQDLNSIIICVKK